jgi:hypothetical protein
MPSPPAFLQSKERIPRIWKRIGFSGVAIILVILEGQFTVVLANAQHIKNVPGRKTDQKDAEWIAEWLQYGLLRASYIPCENHPRSTRPDQNTGQSVPGSFTH